MYAFNGSLGTNGHENGSLDVAVVRVDDAGAGLAEAIRLLQFKGHVGITLLCDPVEW